MNRAFFSRSFRARCEKMVIGVEREIRTGIARLVLQKVIIFCCCCSDDLCSELFLSLLHAWCFAQAVQVGVCVAGYH